jgi:hypothetical protein
VKSLHAFYKPYGVDRESMTKILSDFRKVLMTIHKRRPDLTVEEFKAKALYQYNDEIENEDEYEEEEDEDEGPEYEGEN